MSVYDFLIFLSNLDYDKAEDINGVVNPEHEKPDVDEMDEGLLPWSGWLRVLFLCLPVSCSYFLWRQISLASKVGVIAFYFSLLSLFFFLILDFI